jgi:hypothetical protein
MSYNPICTHSPTSRSKNLNTSPDSPPSPFSPHHPKHSQLSHSRQHKHPLPPSKPLLSTPQPYSLLATQSPPSPSAAAPLISDQSTLLISPTPCKNVPHNLPPPLLRPPHPRTYQAMFPRQIGLSAVRSRRRPKHRDYTGAEAGV